MCLEEFLRDFPVQPVVLREQDVVSMVPTVLNIFGGAEIPFGNDGYGLFLEAIAFCLELDRFFALL
ncbi:MAG: hypothetical protein ACLR7Z_13410 [Bilophila wadsworthia]